MQEHSLLIIAHMILQTLNLGLRTFHYIGESKFWLFIFSISNSIYIYVVSCIYDILIYTVLPAIVDSIYIYVVSCIYNILIYTVLPAIVDSIYIYVVSCIY